jgi:integrase/recombinase XerD
MGWWVVTCHCGPGSVTVFAAECPMKYRSVWNLRIYRVSLIPSSFRDKAILTLLCRSGQRIGDWSTSAGRHGILGMSLSDVDRKRQLIVVRLKGVRDEHRVPVTDDFWPAYERYLKDERRAFPNGQSLWVALRKGRGKPLTYASLESSLRYISRKASVPVHPHLFRHTLA